MEHTSKIEMSIIVKPKVSVLIPVFNREKFIGECVDSALTQTFGEIEIVIVDNASDDGTWEICERLARMDPRVRIFRNERNVGPVLNWVRCAEEARGEFCKILFSDDLLETDCLAEMMNKIKSQDVGFVYSAASIGESKDQARVCYSLHGSIFLSPSCFLKLVLKARAPVSPGAALLRTEDLRRNLKVDFPTKISQPFHMHGAGPDVMILLLTSENYKYVAHLHRPLVFFRAHVGSFSISNENNLVANGYLAAISYYLKTAKSGKLLWVKYMADSWFSQVRLQGKWMNPISFLRAYEGKGSAAELILFTVFLANISAERLFRRVKLAKHYK
jgi:glycosyltransferase involved in cell wall biosynthesis